MKILFIFLTIVILQSCSFDNKSGIWNSETKISKKELDSFKEFKDLNISNNSFNKEINIIDGYVFKIPETFNNSKWIDIFYDKSNNLVNFEYKDLNQKSFKSRKLTKDKINEYIIFEDKHIIMNDVSGNINIYSLLENRTIFKFNFYKKKYKKISKKLNLIVENNIIYSSDNLGYLYAFDYKKEKIIWAKNFKIPFRSNLKIFKDKLILSNQNNELYFINKTSGDILNLIPTEETTIKNDFINNISLNEISTFFLNTFGSLYSIDNETMQINWFLNLNQSLSLSPSDLFFGGKLINSNNKIVVSTNNNTYVMDTDTGAIIYKKNFSSLIKPLIINDNLFLISKNDLLISIDLKTGKIIYSYDINKKIAQFLNTKKKKAKFKALYMINSKLYIFLKNSYVLKFKIDGTLEEITKLPSKLNSLPIVIEKNLIYFDFNNRVSIIN